jgi:hypothetical protein
MRKTVAIIIAIAFVFGFAAQAVFAAEKIMGEVVSIDHSKGHIKVKVDGSDHNLKAAPKLLKGIKVGEKVHIEKDGEKVVSIKKAT